MPLPPETVRDTGKLDEADRARAGLSLVLTDQGAILDAFTGSVAERVLGERAAAALLAVRRHEHDAFAGLAPEQLCERLRLTWTI